MPNYRFEVAHQTEGTAALPSAFKGGGAAVTVKITNLERGSDGSHDEGINLGIQASRNGVDTTVKPL